MHCLSTELDDFLIASLDPLEADTLMVHLPELNQRRDVPGIVQLLRKMTLERKVALEGYHQANAAMRDIGFCLGSIRRHGYEPLAIVPELASFLHEISALVDLPPRDTIMHYTVWNPRGARERTYTSSQEEPFLIESVRISLPSLRTAVRRLVALYDIPISSPYFAAQCRLMAKEVKKLVEGFVLARRNIPPHVFLTQIRPYYEPILVNGKEYIGPGAVTMPLFVFEHVFWSSTVEDKTYVEFSKDYLAYNTAEFRNIYRDFDGRPSLLDRVIEQLEAPGCASDPVAIESARAIDEIFDALVRFRAPHLRVAKDAYEGSVSSDIVKGSGGHSPSTLTVLRDLTVRARLRLVNALADREQCANLTGTG